MRAYGLDPTNGSLATLGDASAAMGKNVMQGVEMMADAVTGEFERLKEFGIKGNKQGGQATFQFTDKNGIQQTRRVMANDRKAIEKAILDIFSQKYDGAMIRLSGTMGGIISNLQDTFARFQQQVMASGAFEAIKQDLLGILETLNHYVSKTAGLSGLWRKRQGVRILACLQRLFKKTD
jgi:glycerol-3-phosphate responsive antiterminator